MRDPDDLRTRAIEAAARVLYHRDAHRSPIDAAARELAARTGIRTAYDDAPPAVRAAYERDAAAVLAAVPPSPLDELAAWADQHGESLIVNRYPGERGDRQWGSGAGGVRLPLVGSLAPTAAEAARRVLDQTRTPDG